jgi:tetratricopeptide (TPR) repeat protein
LAAIFVLALLVRVVYFLELRGTPFVAVLLGDAHRYHAWALEIAGGEWLGSEVFYQAPLYPYWLAVIYALIGPSVWAVRLLQALAGAASCLLLALAGRRFFSPGAGLLAGFLLALYPPAIFFDGLLQKASLGLLFLSTLLFSLAQLLRSRHWSWWLLSGMALGGLVLLRENALVLLPMIAVWLVVYFRRLARTELLAGLLLVVSGVACFLAPVALRNRAVGGELVLTTSQAGPNFFIGNNLEANGRYRPLRPMGGDARVERLDAAELAETAEGRALTPGEVSDYWFERAFDYIRSHPVQWVRLLLKKWLLVWNAAEIVDTDSIEAYAETSHLLRGLNHFWHFGTLAPLAALGLWLTRRQRRRLWLLYGVLLVLASSVSLFYVVARYRFALVPVLALFAGAGLVELKNLGKERDRERLVQSGVVLVLAAVLANYPQATPVDPRATTYLNLGITLGEEGEYARAVPELERALRLVPDLPPAHHALGRTLTRQGKADEAELHFRRALEIDPDFSPALLSLGDLLGGRGELKEAINLLEGALRLESRNAGAHSSLAHLLTQTGRLEEAAGHLRQALAIDPDFALAHDQLANILASRGRLEEAEEAYRRALTLDPDLADAHYKLGILLLDRGDLDRAANHLGRAAGLLPDFAEGHYSLGLALERRERLQEARGAYGRALELEPEHPGAVAAMERLAGEAP